MKNIKNLTFPTIILGLSLSFGSCEKILEIDPIAIIPKDSVFNSDANVRAVLNSCYDVLASDKWYNGRIQQFNDLLGDEFYGAELGSTKGEIYNRNTSIFNGDIGPYHKEPYFAIQRANEVIANSAVISESFRNNAEGQAKFIRAIAFFDLVKIFAQPYGFTTDNSHLGIVMLTEPSTENNIPRSTVKQVYDQIIADLKDAETKLPATNGVYANKWAAKALLARVYFQQNNFQQAYVYANDVLTNATSTKGKTFAQIDFVNLPYTDRFSKTGSQEAIFETVNDVNIIRSNTYRGTYSDGDSPEMKLLPSVYTTNTSNANDKRATAWYAAGNSNLFRLLKKFQTQDFINTIFHFTEMKLIRAEAAAELNQNLPIALSDINDIKRRAFGTAVTLVPANATAAQIKDQVRIERQKEMIGEGDRVQQLKRMGAKGEAIFIRNVIWNCRGMILQFPGSQISLNTSFVKNPEGGCN